MISTLRKIVKFATSRNNLNWLQEESFKLTRVEYSIENESFSINFQKFNERMYSISVREKKSGKYVSLDFDVLYDSSVAVFVSLPRKFFNFWKKSSFYSLREENEGNDVNLKFVWDAIPEYLINLI